tara:strand:+ start:5659 stop:6105 length:447 start_codon:yes stop_codon:yes gene_type:complete
MFKTIIKAIYYAFFSIVIISIILTGWTSYSFVFQSSKSNDIAEVIQDMYANQKSVLIDVLDLSKILIRDKNKKISSTTNFGVTELITDREEESKIDQLQTTKDNGENPLGIVIQPSLPEVNENRLPELMEESLVNENNDLKMSEMEMN